MIPQKGSHVKCVMRNNLVLEGVVESWSDDQSILRSLDDSSLSIIQHSLEDIVVIKVILKKPLQTKKELEIKFEEEVKKPSDDNLRLKNIVELKNMLNNQEKKIIAENLKNHHIGEIKKINYGQPGFFPKPSIK
jgi:hypothetical protein